MARHFDDYFNLDGTDYTGILEKADFDLTKILPFEPLLENDRDKIMVRGGGGKGINLTFHSVGRGTVPALGSDGEG